MCISVNPGPAHIPAQVDIKDGSYQNMWQESPVTTKGVARLRGWHSSAITLGTSYWDMTNAKVLDFKSEIGDWFGMLRFVCPDVVAGITEAQFYPCPSSLSCVLSNRGWVSKRNRYNAFMSFFNIFIHFINIIVMCAKTHSGVLLVAWKKTHVSWFPRRFSYLGYSVSLLTAPTRERTEEDSAWDYLKQILFHWSTLKLICNMVYYIKALYSEYSGLLMTPQVLFKSFSTNLRVIRLSFCLMSWKGFIRTNSRLTYWLLCT